MIGSTDTNEDISTQYFVVINDEEQYSIWPKDQELPSGWHAEGVAGTKEECLAHIEVVWTDMRPRSLREWMEAHPDGLVVEDDGPADETPLLVDRLTSGDSAVEVSLRPVADPAAFEQALDSGYVLLKFTDTRGGTELGVTLDSAPGSKNNEVEIVGSLSLDFETVRCIASVDSATFRGRGRLERIAPTAG